VTNEKGKNKEPISPAPILASVIPVAVLVFLCALIVYGLWRTHTHVTMIQGMARDYISDAAKSDSYRPSLALSFASYAANYEAAMFTKCIALVMAYVLVVLGCVFVVQGIRAYYHLTVEHAKVKSALQTSSPGLVLITLGCALVAVAIFVQTDLSIAVGDVDGKSSKQAGVQTQVPAGWAK